MEIRKYADSVAPQEKVLTMGINGTYKEQQQALYILPYRTYIEDMYDIYGWMQPQPTYAQQIALKHIQTYKEATNPEQWAPR